MPLEFVIDRIQQPREWKQKKIVTKLIDISHHISKEIVYGQTQIQAP